MELEVGMITKSGNFILTKKIEDIHELIEVLYKEKSIFARRRMYASAVLLNFPLMLLTIWLKHGLFYTATRIK